jgi:hypothetical protein
MMKSRGVLGWIAALSLGAVGCVDDAETSTTESEIGGWGAVLADGEFDAVGLLALPAATCTGTLIAERFVLTGSHCICPEAAQCESLPDVVTGSFTLFNVPRVGESTPGDVTYPVRQVFAHPNYEVAGYQQNDIAVIELGPVASGPAADVPPVPLATSTPSVGTSVTLVGYGEAGGLAPDGYHCLIGAGDKRAGTTTITQISNGGAGDLSYLYNTFNIHGCPQDSGGPAFAGPDGPIVGVNVSQNGGKVVANYLSLISRQVVSPGNHVTVFDLDDEAECDPFCPPVVPDPNSLYVDNMPDSQLGWLDPGDVQLTGDFRNTGSDQILYINRVGSTGGSNGLIKIASYADGFAPAAVLYWQAWNSPYHIGFNQFVNTNDKYLVGDFRGLGYDQLLMVNQAGSGPQFKVIDFTGAAPAARYSSTYTNDPLVGWHDADDTMVAGNFRGLGHDQVMLINRAGSDGRIVIVDLSDATVPAEWLYFEHHVDGVQLNGWTDVGDLAIAGDFRGLGYDQIMFVNRGGGTGRVLVADFHDGWFPAEWQYYEPYGGSSLLDGFHDSTVDVALAGDFRGLGYDQVAFVNRNAPWFNRALVADFADGVAPATATYLLTQAQSSPILSRIDTADSILAGDVTARGQDSLVSLKPTL